MRFVKSREARRRSSTTSTPLSAAISGRVHVVHRLVGAPLESAVQRCDRQQARVVARERAVVGELDPLGAAAGELHRQAPERRRERDERAEDLEILRADRGDVDRVRDERALQRGGNLLGDDQPGSVLRLLRRGGEMRRHDHVVELEQRACVRLRVEDVERCGRDPAGAQRIEQGGLVEQLPARGIDDADAVAHRRERRRVDRATGLGGQRQMQGDEVGDGEHLFPRLCTLDPELAKPLLRDERVVCDHSHLQSARAAGHLLADPAEPEHAERLAGELQAAVPGALPAPLLQRRVRLRDVPREREQQPDRVLRRRDDRRLGRIGDDDASPRCRLDVDVVDPDSRSPDHLQPVGSSDQVGVELGRRADDDRVVVPDLSGQVAVRVDVDVEPLAEELDSGLGDRFPNENPGPGHAGRCSYVSSARVTAMPRSMSAPASASASSMPASAVVMSKMSK